MSFKIVLGLAVLLAVNAQTTTSSSCGASSTCDTIKSKIPTCASPCISSAATAAGCNPDNLSCQCASTSVILQSAYACVSSACGLIAGARVLQSASAVCSCVSANSCSSGAAGSSPITSGCAASDCVSVASTIVPSCAQSCFVSAAPAFGCQPTDFRCQCNPETQTSLAIAVYPCVQSKCPASSVPAVLNGVNSVCGCATSTPCPVGAQTGSAANQTTPAATGTSASASATETQTGQQSMGATPASTSGLMPTATGAAATYDCSLVAGVFGAFWLVALAW